LRHDSLCTPPTPKPLIQL
jgi:hypothetical protein